MSYTRTGLGVSLASVTGVVNAAGTAIKPIAPSASGTLATVTSAIQNLFASSTPAVASAPQAQQQSAGMSTPVKIGLGVGAAGAAFLLFKTLSKKGKRR